MGGEIVNKFQLEKCDCANQDTSTGVDWKSELPDDILVGILSTLPLQEAARTSILSPRWENLWKHTSRLDFDAEAAISRLVRHRTNMESLSTEKTRRGMEKVRRLERRKYIEWVNKVIGSYKGFALKELRICFDLDKSSAQKAINCWLQFAFERRVERLELDFSVEGDWGRAIDVCTLPMKKFRPHQPRSLFDSLKYLKALCLKSVDVTEQEVDAILRSCPLLENLVIHSSNKLLNLNICGAFALKHLELRLCAHLESLKVSAPNLISLLVTQAHKLLLENVPKLVDVCVTTRGEQQLVLGLFCCLSQLEILTLDLHVQKETMDKYSKFKFPELPKLKKLEIIFNGRGDESMLTLTSIIRAAPCIQELVIKLYWYKLLRARKNVKNEIDYPHKHLKVVKFLGYYGRGSDEELVKYLVDNCVVLEKLIIDPRYQPSFLHIPLDLDDIDGELPKGKQYATVFPENFDELDAVTTSREYAKKQLQGQIPQHIELVIL